MTTATTESWHRLQRWDAGNPAPALEPELWTQALIRADRLHLAYRLSWDPERWPLVLFADKGVDVADPQRLDGLWQHTCFEAFVGVVGVSGYWEFNVSPAGDWNVYRFSGYRTGQSLELAYGTLPLSVSVQPGLLQLELCCSMPPTLHGQFKAGTGLELGLTAVLEVQGGELSYWALEHAGQEPDFHDRRSWVMRL